MSEQILSTETIILPSLRDFINNSNIELNELLENIDTPIREDIGVIQKKAEVVQIIRKMETGQDAIITINKKLVEATFSENKTQLDQEAMLLVKLSESINELQESLPLAFDLLIETIKSTTAEHKKNQQLRENSGKHWSLTEIEKITLISNIKEIPNSIPQKLTNIISKAILLLIGQSNDEIRLRPLKNKKLFS